MPSGIFGATLTTLTNGTTANANDVMTDLNALKNNGVNNDGTAIQTDGSGNIITPAGQLRNVTFLSTPYHLTNNPTITAGNTITLTCTGVGGIPSSGVIAVIIGINLYSVIAGGTCQIYPAGATAAQYANLTPQWTANNQYTGFGAIIVPVSAGGQITAKAVSQNMVLQDWYIYGYLI